MVIVDEDIAQFILNNFVLAAQQIGEVMGRAWPLSWTPSLQFLVPRTSCVAPDFNIDFVAVLSHPLGPSEIHLCDNYLEKS